VRFFISYTTSDGEDFAHRAKAILSAHGHEAWVWKTDHTPGVGTWQEIASEILARDILLCVVTSASLTSDAQRREVNLALNRGKRITALKHVDTEILPELSGQNYERFSEDEFDTVCRSVATRVDREATSSTDPALLAITKHHRFIQELRAQVHGLNPDVLALANREAQESYTDRS
jgi:hypothetical protein